MKILFVGVFSDGSTNVSQSKALERAGAEVVMYSYRKREQEIGASERDSEIIKLCCAESCDVVLLSKCNGLGECVVPGCRSTGAKVFLWYMDPMWNFTPEIEKRVLACDMTFCALTEPFRKAKEMVPEKAQFLHEGYDADVDKPWLLEPEYDVSFIGNLAHSERRLMYAEQVEFTNITDAYGEEHAKAVCRSRINLNFTHGGTSDRAYKVLAVGGFLLTEPWPGMDDDFQVGVDLDTFESPQELKEKIGYWLANADKRLITRLHGMQTVHKFSRDAWARMILVEAGR